MPGKIQIRREMRRKRRAIDLRQRQACALGIAAAAGRCSAFLGATRVAIFAANDGEIDLSRLPQRYPAKTFYLPVIPPGSDLRMNFAPFDSKTRLVPNRYGIPEPDVEAGRLLAPAHLDLVLTPLVAFDRAGGRVGMGGGYYDATFAFLSDRSSWRRPKLVGAAYAFQEVDRIALDPWDVPVQGVLTESESIEFPANLV